MPMVFVYSNIPTLKSKFFAMKSYLAKIVFRIICDGGAHTAQFDEQLRLIVAEEEELAFIKAVFLGHTNEKRFENIHKQMVEWKFVNVSEVILMNEMIDGAEVYSSIKECDDGADYERNIHTRAKLLKMRCVEMLGAAKVESLLFPNN